MVFISSVPGWLFPRKVPKAETENLKDFHWLRPSKVIQKARTGSCTPIHHFPLNPENWPHFSQAVIVTDSQGLWRALTVPS